MAAVRHLGFVMRMWGPPTKEGHLVVFITVQNLVGDSSGAELCARILKSLAKAAWCLWRVSTVFTHSVITPPEVKRFGWKLWHIRSILLIAAGPGKGHIAVTCRITLNHLSTAAMRLMSNYFHHLLFLDAHIDSRTDSQSLRAEYCIVFIQHNTAI